jgi:nicotinamidase-related amidase
MTEPETIVNERLPRHPSLLDPSRAALLVIDIQKVLLDFIWEKEKLVRNTGRMLEIARIHNLPVVVTEHNPKGLGPTDEKIVNMFKETGIEFAPLEKDIFSCCGHAHVLDAIVNM